MPAVYEFMRKALQSGIPDATDPSGIIQHSSCIASSRCALFQMHDPVPKIRVTPLELLIFPQQLIAAPLEPAGDVEAALFQASDLRFLLLTDPGELAQHVERSTTELRKMASLSVSRDAVLALARAKVRTLRVLHPEGEALTGVRDGVSHRTRICLVTGNPRLQVGPQLGQLEQLGLQFGHGDDDLDSSGMTTTTGPEAN